MAQITRTETRVQKRYTGSPSTDDEVVTEVTTVVRSSHGFNVATLRDFCAALDATEAPDAMVIDYGEANRGHLTAQWTVTVDTPTP